MHYEGLGAERFALSDTVWLVLRTRIGMSKADKETAAAQAPIYSAFQADPDMVELIEMFVEEMPQRVEALTEAFGRADLETVRVLSHQLKGSAGGYGFEVITEAASQLEYAVREDADLETLKRQVDELTGLCQRAVVGSR